MDNYKAFETDRLILQPTSTSDAQMIFELLNSPKWLKYIGDRKVHSQEAAKDYIQHRMLPQLEKLGFGNYTVIRKSDQAKMGICGLYDRKEMEGLDLGFAYLPAYERQGYAYEAANKILEAGFNIFGYDKINAITSKENTASQKLLEKLGFQLHGTTQLPQETEELLLYIIEKK
ncbi:GNAT family N-acetyltransferase [Weeksellaceae bacterium KMM 9713]|uniref:GNAT family N-acetyltransferase n=1 Tax=Profundicola chukchiensis TaxID=2961959 RepID=A0A9X4N3V5_9FLAO|nr:GNAT family N-acetyltransferase [Profundicola chukchiensis]MDG4946389.1 GNAT family N-acetyltransferase [Profundicola chukchiensis]